MKLLISRDFWSPWDLDSLPDQRNSKKGRKESRNQYALDHQNARQIANLSIFKELTFEFL